LDAGGKDYAVKRAGSFLGRLQNKGEIEETAEQR